MAQAMWRAVTSRLIAWCWSPAGVTVHLGLYLVAGTGLILLNAIGTPGDLWFWRPLVIWGVILALHATIARFGRRPVRLPALPVSFLRAAIAAAAPLRAQVRAAAAAWSAPQFSIVWRPRPFVRGQSSPPPPAPALSPAPFTTWPASPALPTPADRPGTWPAPAPAWATSWPDQPPAAAPAPPARPRPSGFDTVLNGAQTADPNHPHWEQLEVAAATWLANRAAATDQPLAR